MRRGEEREGGSDWLRERLAGLYGIVQLPPDGDTAAAVSLGRAVLDGGARVVQLRMKGAAAGVMLEPARALRALARERDAAFLVNDRPDVALASGADGVHVGQEDVPLADVRRIAPGLWVGVSTHNLEQALAAWRGGADYLGFGPVFGTRTKERPDPTTGTAALAEAARRVGVPVVAIGGVTAENAGEARRAGAAACAPIGAVLDAPDPGAAARAILLAFRG